jgi:hypothetical protein
VNFKMLEINIEEGEGRGKFMVRLQGSNSWCQLGSAAFNMAR